MHSAARERRAPGQERSVRRLAAQTAVQWAARHSNRGIWYRRQAIVLCEALSASLPAYMPDQPTITQDSLVRLASSKELEAVQFVIEWAALTSERDASRLARHVAALAHSDHPESQGDVMKPPTGLLLQGPDRQLQITPHGLNVQRKITGDFRRDWNRTREYLERKWQPLYAAVSKYVQPNFIGFIVLVEVSTDSQPFRASEIINAFFRSMKVGTPVDAEFRVAFTVAERYLVNLTLSTYTKYKVTVRMENGKMTQTQEKVDEGLNVRVDVNSKLNVFLNRGPIALTSDDFARILELTSDALGHDKFTAFLGGWE